MVERFIQYINEKSPVAPDEKVLLAVSGGIDSMAMANLFVIAGISIGIAHCNFRLRGRDADLDEDFVRRFALRNHIPFYSASFDTTGYADEKGISIQMAARELRYKWFEEIREENGYSLIALAHNLNDNTETFFINLLRGTGIAGLTGMKPKSGYLIRPLLFATRTEIAGWCRKRRIKFREDLSNADTKYLRNKLRHEVMPVLRSVNPSFDTTIAVTAERLDEVNSLIESFLDDLHQRALSESNNETALRIKILREYKLNSTILFGLFRRYGLSSGQTDDLSDLIGGKTGSCILTPTHRLIKNRDEIIIAPRSPIIPEAFEIGSARDFRRAEIFTSHKVVKVTGRFVIPSGTGIACLDLDKIQFPLIVRPWRHGDSFYPFGKKPGRKKLSDYFTDKKYSLAEKEKQLVLESEGRIVWIIGDRIDNRFRITRNTVKALILASGKNPG